MLGTTDRVFEALRLFRGHVEDALALRTEGHLDRSGDALTTRDLRFDFLAEGLLAPPFSLRIFRARA